MPTEITQTRESQGERTRLSDNELDFLRTEKPLDGKEFSRIIQDVTIDPELIKRFRVSLEEDFGHTMSRLFTLSREERITMEQITRNSPVQVEFLAQTLEVLMEQGAALDEEEDIDIKFEAKDSDEGTYYECVPRPPKCRPDKPKCIEGTILIPLPPNKNPDNARIPLSEIDPLSRDKLEVLSVGESLTPESFQMVVDDVAVDAELAGELAASLRDDFAFTLAKLFDLTREERISAFVVGRRSPESVSYLASVLYAGMVQLEDESGSIEIVSVDFSQAAQGQRRKPEFHIKIKAECKDLGQEIPNCSIGGEAGIKF